MSNKVKPGWLKDASGERIAPKTFISQVLSEDGKTLDKVLENNSAAIIDVIELPNENIKEDNFYRLLTGKLVTNQVIQNIYKCYCVEALPEVGKPATNIEQTEGNVYYNVLDGELYGYVDDILSIGLSVPTGWYTASVLLDALSYVYSGVITDIKDDPCDDAFRFLLEHEIYSYKEGKWTSHKVIGKAGTGASAEVFNHPSNKATGECSHAEGYCTTAGGYSSHAEGYCTIADGYGSHAEGYLTSALGKYSHVQGRYNLYEGLENMAHIVGNGNLDGSSRSNAHTLDWEGNAEYQGDVVAYGCGGENPISLVETANGLNNKITTPLTASVGQFLKVKSVDENGKPITWEVSDKPTYTAEEVGALSVDTEIPSIEGLATEEYVETKIAELSGTVEITDGEPTEVSTVMTLNPNADEVQLYTAPEIDAMFGSYATDVANMIGGIE